MSKLRRKLSDEEVETLMVPKIVEAIYPVLIPMEQQDCAIQAKNHARMTEIARQVWRTFSPQPVPWDFHSNRHYEPVEQAAKQIYDSFVFDGVGQKPQWTPHGNGIMQDKARARARELLHRDGHKPA